MSTRFADKFFTSLIGFVAGDDRINAHELMFPWVREATERRRDQQLEWRRIQLEREQEC